MWKLSILLKIKPLDRVWKIGPNIGNPLQTATSAGQLVQATALHWSTVGEAFVLVVSYLHHGIVYCCQFLHPNPCPLIMWLSGWEWVNCRRRFETKWCIPVPMW